MTKQQAETAEQETARREWDRLHLKGPQAIGGQFDFQQVVATRDATGPAVGSEAPDFDLPLMDQDDQRVQLSAQRGRPVALIFGSYT